MVKGWTRTRLGNTPVWGWKCAKVRWGLFCASGDAVRIPYSRPRLRGRAQIDAEMETKNGPFPRITAGEKARFGGFSGLIAGG